MRLPNSTFNKSVTNYVWLVWSVKSFLSFLILLYFGGHQMSLIQQLEQSNFVLFCTHAADLRNHFQYLVVTILVSCTSLPYFYLIAVSHCFLAQNNRRQEEFCV